MSYNLAFSLAEYGKTPYQIAGKPTLLPLIDRIKLYEIDCPMIACTSAMECYESIQIFCDKERNALEKASSLCSCESNLEVLPIS